jgi:hypothetical protein
MAENKNIAPFFYFLDFNDPVLIELGEKIRTHLENKPSNLSRELQIRTLVYINFNKYLTLLMTDIPEPAALEVFRKKEEDPAADTLELIALAIHKSKEEIINNFIKIWES